MRDDAADQLAQLHRLEIERDGTGFGLRNDEQVVGEMFKSFAVAEHDTEGVLGHDSVFQPSLEQCLEIAVDDGERRAQFVRDIGDKLAADALQAFDFRDVVHDNDGARLAAVEKQWGNAEFEDAQVASLLDRDLAASGPSLAQRLFHQLLDIEVAEGFHDGFSGRRTGKAEDFFQPRVAEADLQLGVHDEHALGDAAEDGIETETLAGRGAVEIAHARGDGFEVAFGAAQAAGKFEHEGHVEVVARRAAQAIAQTEDAGDVAAKRDEQDGRRDRDGCDPVVAHDSYYNRNT